MLRLCYEDNTLQDTPKEIIRKYELKEPTANSVEEYLDLAVRCGLGRNKSQLIRNNAVKHNVPNLVPTKHEILKSKKQKYLIELPVNLLLLI